MAEATVTEVVIRRADMANPRFTPRELRMIHEQLGRTFMEILTDDASDDKFTIFAWLKLRRDGHELSWDDMDDVVLTVVTDETPDPTNGRSEQLSKISPDFASSGE